MRLIDADELKETIFEKTDSLEDLWDTAGVLNAINNAPTVEGEILTKEAYSDLCLRASQVRPQGKWIKGNAYYDERANAMFDKCKCSICGITQSFYEDNETGELYSFNFCPNCGVDMRGEKNESI